MNNGNNFSKLEKQQRFWDAYRGAAEENRVRTDLLAYYVKWVKTFVDFMSDKNLRERSGKDIETFLMDLVQRPNVADWQVRQARHALKILYEMFLPHYAPATTPASESKRDNLIVLSNSLRQHIHPGSQKHPCHTTQTDDLLAVWVVKVGHRKHIL
jgi:hypothetical protein